ncbi:MAG: DUF3791 domain-containing protein [Eggerthellaceae bacterium]|nr:DUF3791 domain-containing protein [Eggerthellaceae bacterium]
MSESAKQTVLQLKYARIIGVLADKGGMSLEDAMDLFYNSDLFPLIQEGTGDLHCRSDEYLAEDILREKLAR